MIDKLDLIGKINLKTKALLGIHELLLNDKNNIPKEDLISQSQLPIAA